jgi:hypothetical protein
MNKIKPLLTKTGLTTTLTNSEVNRIIKKFQVEIWDADDNVTYKTLPNNKGIVIVKFKTEAQGLRLAKKYKKLCDNPSIKMNVTFIKIN